MRQLKRPNVNLPTLIEMAAYVEQPPDDKWNNPDVRGALYAMHGSACAYCQRILSDQRGDVEHFRPKSIYPWLKYKFSNYVMACYSCNRILKNKDFELVPGTARVTVDDPEQLLKEQPLLLDPVDDPVEVWLWYNFDKLGCPVELTAVGQDHPLIQSRAAYTKTFFLLNEDPDLVSERERLIQRAIHSAHAARRGDRDAGETVSKMASRYEPYGIAVRNMLEALYPELLPDPMEELQWLVDKLLDGLERAISVLEKSELGFNESLGTDINELLADNLNRAKKKAERRKQEICWSLAVLWKDPPIEEFQKNDATDLIVAGIDEVDRVTLVHPYYDVLCGSDGG